MTNLTIDSMLSNLYMTKEEFEISIEIHKAKQEAEPKPKLGIHKPNAYMIMDGRCGADFTTLRGAIYYMIQCLNDGSTSIELSKIQNED